ncbi:aspartyl-phosphate phosphatase Spo0E family protein [Peribacillus frigoritolerans]
MKFLRKKLVHCGLNKGLSHWETIHYSQRLDKLIFMSLLQSK